MPNTMPMSRRFALIAAASLVALAAAGAPAFAAERDNFLIVPGKSFGPIKKGATLGVLQRIYGKANIALRKVQPPHADFEQQSAAVIFPGTPNEAVALLSARNRVEGVFVEQAGGKWRTKDGLSVGLGLAAMERIHGRPFRITGFGRDGGGAVNSTPRDAPYRALYIRFLYPEGKNLSQADMAALSAEQGFRSNHPAARRAKLTVSVIWWGLTR